MDILALKVQLTLPLFYTLIMPGDITVEYIGELKKELQSLRKRLNDLTAPLVVMLKRRNFLIHSKEPGDDLLVPDDGCVDDFYRMMKGYAFRLFLRDVIKMQGGFKTDMVARYATRDVTEHYISFLREKGVIDKRGESFFLKKGPVKSFGETLEWFVAEIFKREFMIEATWGVKFRGRKVGGDYDVIGKIDGGLLYMEVKSSPPRQVYDREVRAFWSRVIDLCPDMSVFLMDTHLRMKDKLVPMFEKELGERYDSPPEVKRIKAELFAVEDRVFLINAKPSIEGNLETIVSYFLKRRCR